MPDKSKPQPLLKALTAAALAAWAYLPALAQAAAEPTSVGQVMVNTHNQFAWAMPLISAVSYIVGTTFVVQVLQRAVQHSENPSKGSVVGIVNRSLAASAFFQVPQVMMMLRATLFKDGASYDTNGKLDGVSGEGLDAALVHMVTDVRYGLTLVVGLVAFFSGALMITGAIAALGNQGYQQDQISKKSIAVRFGLGTALITFGPLVKTMLQTVFNTTTGDAVATLAYSKAGLAAADATRVDNVFNAIFVWLGLIGLIAILRGLWVLYGSLEGKGGPGSLMAPLTHLIAGAALVNIVPAIHLVEATLGCGDGSACQILT